MRVAVYLPLVLPAVAAVSARWVAGRLTPRTATWVLTVLALVLALASGLALTALTATVVGQIPLVAALGDWSATVLSRDDPASMELALTACLLLALALAAAWRTALRHGRALLDAARAAHGLPTCEPGGRLVVVDDPCPDAYALPGLPGRIVVSTGMLDELDERERAVLLAHERAHLDCAHHLFVAVARLAAAANPLLRPVAAAVGYTAERWADECAADVVGDRRAVATTIAKAALLVSRHGHASRRPAGALSVIGASWPARMRGAVRMWRAGPVPRRVAALLVAPPRQHRVLLVAVLVMLVVATAASIEAARDLESLFELARLGG